MKQETPFKCYIYMTEGDAVYPVTLNGAPYICSNVGGKCVIGEFVCDRISPIAATSDGLVDVVDLETTCVSVKELFAYSAGKLPLYGWHISDLVIYDKPRELCEFVICEKTKCPAYLNGVCLTRNQNAVTRCENLCCQHKKLTRPPQSWCYVDGGGEGE